MKIYENIHDAYLGTLADVYDNPDYVCSPRGQTVREKLYYGFQITTPKNESIITYDESRNKTIESYTAKECEWHYQVLYSEGV